MAELSSESMDVKPAVNRRGTVCCVPMCASRGGHKFPRDVNNRTAWIVAIKRAGKTPTSKWAPSNSAVVCGQHFVASDYASVTYHGKRR